MQIRIEIGDNVRLEIPAPGPSQLQLVTLRDTYDRKIAVIKEIRNFTFWGLKEAKDASEALPRTFSRSDAPDLEGFASALLAAGADITQTYATDTDAVSLINRIIAAIYAPAST
jgi:hypothetical protein